MLCDQVQLHKLWWPEQNEKARALVEKSLRILRWWQKRIQPSGLLLRGGGLRAVDRCPMSMRLATCVTREKSVPTLQSPSFSVLNGDK